MNFLPSTSWCFKPWASQGDPGKSSNFKPLAKTLTNEKKCRQGYQQTPKWHLKPSLWTPNYWISRKREITQNIWFLQWLWHMQPFHSGIISISGQQKTWTLKLSVILPPRITEKWKNVSEVGPGGAPQIRSKIDENQHLSPSVSIGCPRRTQDNQNSVPGTQEGASRPPKS